MAFNLLSYLRLPMLASSGFALLASSALYFKQNELIYPRSLPAGARTEVPTPQQFGIADTASDSINLTTPDGETLHAFLIQPENVSIRKRITILMFHGNAGNIGHRVPIAKILSQSIGATVFMLEYRGYGLSTGDPSEVGLNIDAQTAFDYLLHSRPDLRNDKIVVYGQSLGGAVAIKLVEQNQSNERLGGLILENTFTSIRKLIPSAFPPARYLAPLCHQRWASDEALPRIAPESNLPVLFLSGLKDEIVPCAMMRSLYDVCNLRKRVWQSFPNGDHNSTVAELGYFDAIWHFLLSKVMTVGEKGGKDMHVGSVDMNQDELWA